MERGELGKIQKERGERRKPMENEGVGFPSILGFIRLRRRPWAFPVDECVTRALPLHVLKLVASADFASGE